MNRHLITVENGFTQKIAAQYFFWNNIPLVRYYGLLPCISTSRYNESKLKEETLYELSI